MQMRTKRHIRPPWNASTASQNKKVFRKFLMQKGDKIMKINLHGYKTMDYKELLQIEYDALDLLPIKDFLKKDMEISEIRYAIEEMLNSEIKAERLEFWNYMDDHEDFFKGDIFNWMDEDEFLQYCENRFPDIHWGHEIVERYWVAS